MYIIIYMVPKVPKYIEHCNNIEHTLQITITK